LDFVTATQSQTIRGSLSANLASGESVQVSLDNGSTWTQASATVGSNLWSLSGATLLAGTHTLLAKVSTAVADGQTYRLNYTYNAPQVPPIVIDLNQDGMLSYGNVVMDVNGDGQLDATKWAGALDGVLVWDKYGDGQVHDHSQYAFAQYDTTSVALGKTATDLSGLADAFDSNKDGVFDAHDAMFADFRVWQDANQNGVSDSGEVKTLAELGLASLNLTSDGVARNPDAGVHEAGRTWFTTTDGQQVLVADVAFEFSTLALAAHGVSPDLIDPYLMLTQTASVI
jgi:hypothetical protein